MHCIFNLLRNLNRYHITRINVNTRLVIYLKPGSGFRGSEFQDSKVPVETHLNPNIGRPLHDGVYLFSTD